MKIRLTTNKHETLIDVDHEGMIRWAEDWQVVFEAYREKKVFPRFYNCWNHTDFIYPLEQQKKG